MVLGDEGGPLAVFGIADSLRPDAKATVEALREAGVEELVMLTGDAEAPARRVAEELGVGYRARLLPSKRSRLCGIWSTRRDQRAWWATG